MYSRNFDVTFPVFVQMNTLFFDASVLVFQWPFYKIVWSMTWMDSIYLAYQVRFMDHFFP